MWGPVYEEEAHDIYSWRVFGLAGVVEGRGVVGEYVKNPIEPGTLSLKHGASWAKAIDEVRGSGSARSEATSINT